MQSPLQGFLQPPGRSTPAPHLLFQTNSTVQQHWDSPHSAQGLLCLLQSPKSHIKKIIHPYLCTIMEVSKVLVKGQENLVADLADCSLK